MKAGWRIFFHVLYWLYWLDAFLWLRQAIFRTEVSEEFSFTIFRCSFAGLAMLLFYTNYGWLLPRFFRPGKYGVFAILFTILMGAGIALRYLTEQVIIPHWIGYGNYSLNVTASYYIRDNIYFIGLILAGSAVFWFVEKVIRTEQEKSQLREEVTKAQQQILQHQMSPHFLFNTLNNIYSLVYGKSDKALPVIEKFSLLMRYSLEKGTRDSVALADEVNHLSAYIDLQRVRLSNPAVLIYTLPAEIPEGRIAPLILVPFVENAFKHGVSMDPEHPITIHLWSEGHLLRFDVTNAILQGEKDWSSGIGLKNVEQRLRLIYPDQHLLAISVEENYFRVRLSIDLRPT